MGHAIHRPAKFSRAVVPDWLAQKRTCTLAGLAFRIKSKHEIYEPTMRLIAATLLVFQLGTFPLPAMAQSRIDPTQGLKHVGKNVLVRMKVVGIGRAGVNVALNSRDSWKAEDCLIIWIDPVAQAAFKKKGIRLPGHFARETIEVTGRLKTISPGGLTRPAIVVSDPADIRIVVPAKSTVPATKPPAKVEVGTSPIVITPEQGLQYIGKHVRVRLRPESLGRSGEVHNVNSGRSWDAPGNFQVRFEPKILAAFAKDGIEHPGLHLLRKHIEVTGVVREIRPGGKRVPAIDLKSLADLKYVLESTRQAPSISELLNRQIDIHLRGGKRYGDLVVTALETGKDRESIVNLKVKSADGRLRLYRASAVEEIIADGIPLDLSFDRKNRVLVVDEEKRKARIAADEETERRVLSISRRLWPRLTDEEHAQWIAKHKEFLQSVQKHFPQLPLRVIETKYYLILTDIPDGEASKYLGYLDTLYDEMCRAFGIPQGSNIWCGKCVVCAFQNRADFIRFEIEVIKNTKGNPTNAGGICHAGGDGKVVISLFKGSHEARFATVLVHETSHGFVARFRSDVRIPSWLNEGMAVWIARYIVKDDTYEKAQRKAIVALKAQQTLAGFFDGSQIPGDQYGSGASMVNILISRDSGQFRQFFTDIKLGYPTEDALKRSFKLSFADLTTLYGRSIGLPNLKH